MPPDTITSARAIGCRLNEARESLGLSTRTVAGELARRGVPVSHATIVNYESGRSVPAPVTLRLLAQLYRRPEDWFVTAGCSLAGVRYRALKGVRAIDRRMFEGQASQWLSLYLELESICQECLKPTLNLSRKPKETSAQLASRIREEAGIGAEQPIPSMVRLLEAAGVRVIQVSGIKGIDALAAKMGDVAVVVINSNLPHDRFRLTAGHELDHHLSGDCDVHAEASDEDESRAHDLASHLLMPDSVLQQAFVGNSMVRLVNFKERYGISLAAMIFRAHKKRLISDTLYQRIWKDFARLGWRKNEPGEVVADRPTRLEELIDSAVQNQRMSFGDIARIAGVDESQVRQRRLLGLNGGIQYNETVAEPLRIGGNTPTARNPA